MRTYGDMKKNSLWKETKYLKWTKSKWYKDLHVEVSAVNTAAQVGLIRLNAKQLLNRPGNKCLSQKGPNSSASNLSCKSVKNVKLLMGKQQQHFKHNRHYKDKY